MIYIFSEIGTWKFSNLDKALSFGDKLKSLNIDYIVTDEFKNPLA